MANLDSTITISTSKLRPCYVGDKKALFHRWVDVERPIMRFKTHTPAIYIREVRNQFHEQNIIPADVEIIKTKETFGVVEYEDGTIEEVHPTGIKFADNKIFEYAFTASGTEEKTPRI